MGLLYLAGFQVGGTNTMTLSTLGTGATITPGYYMQGGTDVDTAAYASRTPGALDWEGQQYTDFATAVASAFNAATGATWTVSFNETTGLFSLLKTGGAVALDFTTGAIASNLRLQAALGFSGNKSADTFFQADVVPNYAIVSEVAGRNDVQGPFEPDDIAEESVSDGGVDHVVTRKSGELLMSWAQAMEPRSSVYPFARYVSATPTAWTWEQWFKHCRGTHPFLVVDALDGEPQGAYYRYTAKGASHRPRRVSADFDDYWIVPHEARWLARREPP